MSRKRPLRLSRQKMARFAASIAASRLLHAAMPVRCHSKIRKSLLYHKLSGWGAWIRTRGWRNQNPLPYRLATPQRSARTIIAVRGARNRDRLEKPVAHMAFRPPPCVAGTPACTRLGRGASHPHPPWHRPPAVLVEAHARTRSRLAARPVRRYKPRTGWGLAPHQRPAFGIGV